MSGRLYVKSVRSKKFATQGRSVAAKAAVAATRAAIQAQNRAAAKPNLRMERQLMALVAGKRRDALDVSYSVTTSSVTYLFGLSSAQTNSTAPSGTGLFDMDGDSCQMNTIRLWGLLDNPVQLKADASAAFPAYVRMIVVCFKKPLQDASSAGTLPPILEVLTADTIQAAPVQSTQNTGRFKILSDKTWNLGHALTSAASAAGITTVAGTNRRKFDYTVKINKKCQFKAPCSTGSNQGGHYDSDQAAGQVVTNLLVGYLLVSCASGTQVTFQLNRRINYTG